MRHRYRAWTIVAAGAIFCTDPAAAQGQAQAQGQDVWQYEVSPYLWAAGVDGTTRVGTLSVNSSQSFSDLLSEIDIGLMGAFEARKGRWGIVFDSIYLKLSSDAKTANGTVNVKLVQQLYALGAAWRMVEGEAPIDLIAGMRYNYLKPRLELGGASVEQRKDALDPYIGVRGSYPLDARWSLIGYLDVGTYSGSDYAWQMLAGASYAWQQDRSIKFGYRRFQTKYSNNALEVDTTMQGLYFGAGFRF